MTDTDKGGAPKAKRDRSPAFPFIPLQVAIKRLTAFEDYFKRHPAPAKQVGLAWGMKGYTSQAQQTMAALKYFGLVEYQGSGDNLTAAISDDARTYLRAQQDSIKKEVLKRLATKPKNIAKYFALWGADRPPDPVCLDQLILKDTFTEPAAKTFLSVYDDTIAFAGLHDSDKKDDDFSGEVEPEEEEEEEPDAEQVEEVPSLRKRERVTVMEGERVVFTEETNPQNYLKLIASGEVDETMLDALEDYVKRQKKRLGILPDQNHPKARII
ncbi:MULTISPECIES: hypothetical protein [unclassified Bradyrhizobium]|uniref:hypothetical protein n=1 Tax=unclassified Bradyrhizobium TaxID=2631580 RepID=UPI0028EF01F5|nr:MULTISPECIES: hypothetical protein [unclassified Bradyrhizobium]